MSYTEGGVIFECIIIDAHPDPWKVVLIETPYSVFLEPEGFENPHCLGFRPGLGAWQKIALPPRLEIIYSPSPIPCPLRTSLGRQC